MRVLKLGFWWLLLPLSALVLFILFWLFTTGGARLTASVVETFLPQLTITHINGSIAYGLRAEQVTWIQPEVAITLDGLASVWDPHCLLQGQICVQSLVAGRLGIEVPEDNSPSDPDSAVTPLNLPLLVLPWRLRVEQFHLAELIIDAGGRRTAIAPVAFRAEWTGSRVVVEELRTSTTDADVGALDVRLTGAIEMRSEWPFNAVLQTDYIPPLQDWKSQTIILSGEGNVQNLFLQAAVKADVAIPTMAPLQFNADVTTLDLDTEMQLHELNGHWNNAPLFAKGGVTFSRDGVLELKQLLLRWGKNEATLNGELAQQWNVNAALTLPQPQLLAPDAKGRFDGTAHISGERADPLVAMQLTSEQLALPQFQLRDLHVQASVAPVSFSSLNASAQASEIRVADELLRDLSLTLQGDADAHTLAVQARRGKRHLTTSLQGHLDIEQYNWRGQINQMELQMRKNWTIQLEKPANVRWRNATQTLAWDYHCLQDDTGKVCSSADLDLKHQRGVATLDVANFDVKNLQEFIGPDIAVQGVVNASLQLSERFTLPAIQGDVELTQVQLKKTVQNQPVLQNGHISARFTGKQMLLTTTADIPPGLHWQSDEPVEISWQRHGLHMQKSCWNAARLATESLSAAMLGTLCLQMDADDAAGLALIADLDLIVASALSPWLPPEMLVEGQLQAHADAQIKGRDIQAQLQASVSDGAVLLQQDAEQEPLRLAFDKLQLNADLKDELLSAALDLKSAELGQGNATAEFQIRQQNPQLKMRANLQGINLGIVRPLIPQLSELSGSIDVDVLAEGLVSAPDIRGRVDIHNVQVQSAAVPAGIDDLDAQLIFTGDRGDLRGTVKSGKGRAELLGEMVRLPTGWQSRLNLKGNAIPVHQPPDIRFLLHPDLTLVANGSGIRIEGNVLVNEGFLVLKPLPPDAVGVSSDVEFIDDRGKRIQAGTGIDASMNVVASIEPSLRIRGFGAEVRPKGSVRITLDKSGVMIGRGTIDIEEGSYTGYGQQLTIRKGQLIFNGPLDQPYINLEAVRVVDTVVAGIRVTGPASEPVATFFSEPTLPDSQIIYYIVAGKAPGTGTEDENTSVRNALLSVGLMGGQPLARDIASKVGIDDLQMGTSGSGDETAVTVSGYINSRTYLQYGISVFEPANTLTVRYRLRDNLFLEAISGIASALDLLYSFEF